MRIALVHDWIVSKGGAEKCLEIFHIYFAVQTGDSERLRFQ